jgi:hypothetical protein
MLATKGLPAMKLLDRFLQTVGFFLPEAQKQDILKELSENILSKMEDKEAELGRPLTEAEQEAVLKSYGSPMAVASTYAPETGGLTFGRQLIGPALFPLYVRVLLIGLFISVVIQVTLNITLHLPNDTVFSRLMVQALMQSAAVTFVFILLQYYLTRHPEQQWDILVNGSLPEAIAAQKKPHVSRLESVLQIIFLFIFASVLQGFFAQPLTAFAPFGPAPIWYQLYIPFMLFQVVGIAEAMVCLFRPDWVKFHAAVQMGIEAGGVIVLGILLAAGQWVVLLNPAGADPRLVELLGTINQYALYGIAISLVIGLLQLGWKVWQWRKKRTP